MHILDRTGLAVALLLFSGCSSLAPQSDSIFAPARRHSARPQAYDVEHYALDLAIDPVAESIAGTCTVRLWARDQPLGEVVLDLERLAVEGVRDGEGRALEFEHSDGRLEIDLAERLHPGDFVELEVSYGGHPVRGIWFADRDADGARQLFTQGECEDSRFWFPCWDAPSDRATSELRVTLPADWTAIAAGDRVDQGLLPDGRRFEHWRMSTPHPTYLTTLVAGEFTVLEDVWDGVPLIYLARPEYADWVEASYACTGDVLAFFSEVTGQRYPYSKYGQASVANFPFGGMENISATTMTDTILRDERGRRDYDSTGLIAHEAAHQWFGDLLTNREWSHIWLNESFATYFTQLYMEHARGVDEFRAGVADMQNSYLRGDVGAARRPIIWNLYRDPMDLFGGGQTYPGGASRLHLLRFVLGDEVFFAGIRGYVAEHAGQGVVTTDFQSAMERASGQDLAWFFDTWLRSQGFPEFRWSWSWDPEGQRVVLDVHQVQAFADGTPVVFRTPVDLAARGEGWEEVVRVELNERDQTFEIPCPERPTWVHFDRHGWIPKVASVERSLDEWLAIAGLDEDVNARREAVGVLGRELTKVKNSYEAQALTLGLIDRLAGDEQRSVREGAARALAGVVQPGAREALLNAASTDEVAAVRVAALDALRGVGEDAELAAFAYAQYDDGYSWAVMGAAARLVASADPQAAHDWLVARLDTASPHDVLRIDLLVALRELSGRGVLELLASWAFDPEASVPVRATAVAQLGQLGAVAAGRRSELEDLLGTTNHYRVQSALIRTLGQIGDQRSIPALKEFHQRCEDSRQRRSIEAVLREPWARLTGA